MNKMKPLSQNAIGRSLGVSSACMVKWKKQGCPMDSVESVRAWRKANQNIAARNPEPLGTTARDAHPTETLDAARTRLMVADANLAELKEAELTGELIRVAAVNKALAAALATARDALLQIPARMGPVLAAEKEPQRIETKLHEEIHRTMTNLSAMLARSQ